MNNPDAIEVVSESTNQIPMTNIPFSCTESHFENDKSCTSLDIGKAKSDSITRFFRHKKDHEDSNMPNIESTDDLTVKKTNSLSRRIQKLGKVMLPKENSDKANVPNDNRKSFVSTLTNYWNSVFKKPSKVFNDSTSDMKSITDSVHNIRVSEDNQSASIDEDTQSVTTVDAEASSAISTTTEPIRITQN